MYSKVAEEEDNKMAELWQKDADGILIFVSRRVSVHISLNTNWDVIDRVILCCCRHTACCVYPGPEAKPPGHLRVLSQEHLSASRQPKHIQRVHPPRCPSTDPLHSPEICYLGEFALVLKFSCQSYLCSLGNAVASMGPSIRQEHSTATVQSREESADACILFRRC